METADAARAGAAAVPPILSVADLEVTYDDALQVLRGVSLEVPTGRVVAVLGANGAGKTTLLRAVSGLLGLHRGRITRGAVALDGRPVTGADPTFLVRRGVAQVLEGRRVFAELTVEENLRAGAFTVRGREARRLAHQRVLDLFPVLAARRGQVAGYLSGGEQQMVAIGRALMQSPRLLLLDEPSLGLAPRLVGEVAGIIRTVHAQGTSVLLVEQNAAMALAVADHAVILESGRVARRGPAAQLAQDRTIQQLYLGVGATGRRSYRDLRPDQRPGRADAGEET